MVQIHDPELPERLVRHETGGVIQEQEFPHPGSNLAGLLLILEPRLLLLLQLLLLLVMTKVVKLVCVVKKVEEMPGKPKVVQSSAKFMHDLKKKEDN